MSKRKDQLQAKHEHGLCECEQGPRLYAHGPCQRCRDIETRLERDFHRPTCGFKEDANEVWSYYTPRPVETIMEIVEKRGCVTVRDLPMGDRVAGWHLTKLVHAGKLAVIGMHRTGDGSPAKVYAPTV